MIVNKSGYVAIIGRPNVGKSTLLNELLGEKISITSTKPQTTRWQILGIKLIDDAQIIYIDTPGIHNEEKRAMSRYLNRVATSILLDADIIVFLIEAEHWRSEDELVLKKLQRSKQPIILVLNKIDLLKTKTDLLPIIESLKGKFEFTHIIPVSAKNGENIGLLEQEIITLLPKGPALFPEDQVTDKTIRFQVAEVIREKLIQETEQELPYTTAIEIEEFKEEEKLVKIGAIIWVERPGQKIIVIGKKGARLKKIGSLARREIETLLERKVFLRLWVKVKKHWTDDERALKSLGYQ